MRERQIVVAFEGKVKSAADIARSIGWTRRQTPFADLEEAHQQFAVAETIAHLEHLRARNYARKEDDGTLITYESLAAASELLSAMRVAGAAAGALRGAAGAGFPRITGALRYDGGATRLPPVG